jgi:hypothetical protein
MTVEERIRKAVSIRSGMTEAELSRLLFGKDGYQQRVNTTCRLMIARGELERRGAGGPGDPFTYHATG